jgi:hypothetical protein
MGNDGGVVAVKRRFFVRTKSKPTASTDKHAESEKWTTCAISGGKLRTPIMCDELGTLFDAEAALLFLSSKAEARPGLEHLSKRKHLTLLKTQSASGPAAASAGSSATTDFAEDKEPVFQCPITGLQATGRHEFVALRPCGHVVAARLLHETPQDRCWVCDTPFVATEPEASSQEAAWTAARRAAADPAPSLKGPCPGWWAGTDLVLLNPSPPEQAGAKVILALRRSAAKRPRSPTSESNAKRVKS